jgi:hypothetical protein
MNESGASNCTCRGRRTIDLCSRGERRVVGESFGSVVIGTIDVFVFLYIVLACVLCVIKRRPYTGKHAVQPVEDFLGHASHAACWTTLGGWGSSKHDVTAPRSTLASHYQGITITITMSNCRPSSWDMKTSFTLAPVIIAHIRGAVKRPPFFLHVTQLKSGR